MLLCTQFYYFSLWVLFASIYFCACTSCGPQAGMKNSPRGFDLMAHCPMITCFATEYVLLPETVVGHEHRTYQPDRQLTYQD